MSDFCGIVSREKGLVDSALLQNMQGALNTWQADRSDTILHNNVGMGQHSLWITPESVHEKLPQVDDDLMLVADVRIDNREELMGLLSLSPSPSLTDTDIILHAYRKWAENCAYHIVGEFVFVIWDKARQRLYCAKDHVGTRPLYYAKTAEFFVFSTELKGIFATGLIRKELNQAMLAADVMGYVGENRQTVYRNVSTFPGGHWLSMSQGGEPRTHRYWSPDITHTTKLAGNKEYEEKFRELLSQAVRRRTRCAYPVGGLLSGGVDSTAIIGITLQDQLHNTPLHIYSWAHDLNTAKDYPDDREFITDFLELHSNREFHHSFLSGLPGYFSLMEAYQGYTDQPFHDGESHVRLQTYETARKDGVRTLLSGVAGDALVSHHAIAYVANLFFQMRWGAMFKELRNITNVHGSWKGNTWRYLVSPLMDFARGKEFWGKGHALCSQHFYEIRGKDAFLNPEFVRKSKIQAFIKGGPATQSLPGRWKCPVKQQMLLNLEYGPLHASFNQRYHILKVFGLQYTYPLLDRDLLTFMFSLPIDQFHQNGYGRSLIRRSLKGVAPASVSKNPSKRISPPRLFSAMKSDIQWLETTLRSWEKEPLISNVLDLKAMSENMEMVKTGGRIDFRNLIRAIQTGIFLQKTFV